MSLLSEFGDWLTVVVATVSWRTALDCTASALCSSSVVALLGWDWTAVVDGDVADTKFFNSAASSSDLNASSIILWSLVGC